MIPAKTYAGYVAICGRPNAGKSTLLNALLNSEISIVSPKAQTTRERVLGILTEKNRQMIFLDTPGIHQAKPGGMNEFMVNEAREAIRDAEVVWYLLDQKSELKHEQVVLDILAKAKVPVYLVLSKSDEFAKFPEWEPRRQALVEAIQTEAQVRAIQLEQVFTISSVKRKGLLELMTATWKKMPEGSFFYPDPEQISDRPTRFFVGEKIREQLLSCLGEEVPYSCAVEVERFDEKVKPWRIEAVVHVERESQKGIVIGQGAHKIKEIGTKARGKIELFLGEKVHLGLKVKVLSEWTRDRKRLEKLGYVLPAQQKTGGVHGTL